MFEPHVLELKVYILDLHHLLFSFRFRTQHVFINRIPLLTN